ncbi:hypothetical protein E5676_scaffold461G00120 [Cucumis melo var. makuwa]|uniref:Uncharacterized protein n=1 Tax=Cucumis melo var. makuwa TaxID=1194695 RepID=A0A5D3CTK0_CUCMM|nr:hypothetical protein E5676_scaffold461G00120 [Cucumis melo var. makuwa]
MTTRRLQLYSHQLTTKANVWFFFIKKKILLTRHDSMVPFEYAMLLYCIMMKQAFNLGYVMQEALLTWMKNPKGGRCSLMRLNRVINLSISINDEVHRIKTMGKKQLQEDDEHDSSPPLPLKRKAKPTSNPYEKND